MARTVKLSDDVMSLVIHESEIQSRSIADQIAHWIRIGRAVEESGKFNYNRVLKALAGERPVSDLTDEEAAFWLDDFVKKMETPGPEEEAFFENRRGPKFSVPL